MMGKSSQGQTRYKLLQLIRLHDKENKKERLHRIPYTTKAPSFGTNAVKAFYLILISFFFLTFFCTKNNDDLLPSACVTLHVLCNLHFAAGDSGSSAVLNG